MDLSIGKRRNKTRGQRRAGHELVCVAAVLLVLVLVNLATIERSPTVWLDEVQFTDPAVNLALGKGFTTTAWPQSPDELWTGNAPLHSLLLAGWIRMLGFSPLSVRSVNLVYLAMAVLLVWVAMRHWNWIESETYRLLAVGLLVLDGAVAFSYRSGRYDCLGMLWLAMAAAASSVERKPLRMALLFTAGFLTPSTGLQLLPYAALLAVVLLVLWGRATLRFTVPFGVGILAGSGALLGMLIYVQSYGGFLQAVRYTLQESNSGVAMGPRVAAALSAIPETGTFHPGVGVVVCVMAAGLWAMGWNQAPALARMGAVLFFLAPMSIGFLYRFPRYYVWMVAAPCVLGAVALCERVRPVRRGLGLGMMAGLLLAAGLGLPARLALAGAEWKLRDYAPVVALAEHVPHGATVYAHWQGFYALRSRNARVFYPEHKLSEAERAAVEYLVVSPADFPGTVRLVGGQWRMEAVTGSLEYGRSARLYHLAVYRRE